MIVGIGDNLSIAKDDIPSGVASDPEIVGNKNYGYPLRLVELLEQFDHLAAGSAIEISRWFVPHEDRGSGGKGSSDSDALLLSAGELTWMVIESITEPDEAKQFFGAIVSLAGRHSGAVEHRKLDVFQSACPGQKIEVLENKSDLFVPDTGSHIRRHIDDLDTIEQVASTGWAIETSESIHQCRFSRAAGADESDVFPALHFEVDAIERSDLDLI